MCLGVPGKVMEIVPDSGEMTMGKVAFGGVAREVCLAYVPEVAVGDWVIVHAGFALQRLDEDEARSVFEALAELEQAQAAVAREQPLSWEPPPSREQPPSWEPPPSREQPLLDPEAKSDADPSGP